MARRLDPDEEAKRLALEFFHDQFGWEIPVELTDLAYPARQGLASDCQVIYQSLFMMFFMRITDLLSELEGVSIDSPLDQLVRADSTRQRLEEFLKIVNRAKAKVRRESSPTPVISKDIRVRIVTFLSKMDRKRPD
jgi:hypothetical protein